MTIKNFMNLVKGAFCIFAMYMIILMSACTEQEAPLDEKAATPYEAVGDYLESTDYYEEEGYDIASYEVTGIKVAANGYEYIDYITYDEEGHVLFGGAILKDTWM